MRIAVPSRGSTVRLTRPNGVSRWIMAALLLVVAFSLAPLFLVGDHLSSASTKPLTASASKAAAPPPFSAANGERDSRRAAAPRQGDAAVSIRDADPSHFCFLLDGASYRGTVNTTRSGRPCQRWAAQTPHRHDFRPEAHPEAGLVGNFCRNPAEEDAPWCFVAAADGAATEPCGVPECPPTAVSVPVPHDLRSGAKARPGGKLQTPNILL
ncbi:Kringle-like protein [Baffinella frigidus]|nr:Kringle-like protein [Cryptophyta sp. CCMP2293]